ncbi:MAG: hypothetical protein CSB47_08415 [Proteobacteria bacterium]|nr:MAG: hypothetical protein CSB47_08415 [Pseudomonadota bacterium]
MKFKKLKKEVALLADNDGTSVDPEVLVRLKGELSEKKAKFVRKLRKGIDLETREKVERRLEQVCEMIKVVKAKQGDDSPAQKG